MAAKPIHIDLGPLGFEGQWIDVVDVGAKSPAQFKATIALQSDDTAESARAFFASVIDAWCITDPASGTALPPPSSTSWALEQIPMRITKTVTENVNAQVEDVLPKVRGG